MTPKDLPSPAEKRFSSSALMSIQNVLTEHAGISAESAELLTSRIELMSGACAPEDDTRSLTKIRGELFDLQRSIGVLDESLRSLSSHTVNELYRSKYDDSTDQDVLAYDADDVHGSTLAKFKSDSCLIQKVVELAIARTKLGPGAPPNVAARFIAYFVAECLWDHDIRVSTHESGIYFQILRVVFPEVMSEISADAHRRPGEWAIKNKGNIKVQFYRERLINEPL